jgi:hypothetical protein
MLQHRKRASLWENGPLLLLEYWTPILIGIYYEDPFGQ